MTNRAFLTGTAPFHLADTVLPAHQRHVDVLGDAGSTCGATSGSGNTIETTANLAASGVATYTVTATIPPITRGSISNMATVDGGASGAALYNTADDTRRR